jgi:hypothetical protein
MGLEDIISILRGSRIHDRVAPLEPHTTRRRRRCSVTIETARNHHPRLITLAYGSSAVHGSSAVGRVNSWLAVKITTGVGSMWCAYLFALLALVSLPSALRSGSAVIIVSWVSQTFLQLVLLSVIIVGQKVQEAAADLRAEADHETLQAIHTLTVAVHDINVQQTVILEKLEKRG